MSARELQSLFPMDECTGSTFASDISKGRRTSQLWDSTASKAFLDAHAEGGGKSHCGRNRHPCWICSVCNTRNPLGLERGACNVCGIPQSNESVLICSSGEKWICDCGTSNYRQAAPFDNCQSCLIKRPTAFSTTQDPAILQALRDAQDLQLHEFYQSQIPQGRAGGGANSSSN